MTKEVEVPKQALLHRGGEDSQSGWKVIRDGFSMPLDDYGLIAEIREQMLAQGLVATKSGILRAGLHALARIDPEEQLDVINSLAAIKIGRPLDRE